jgi:hypothetical protein
MNVKKMNNFYIYYEDTYYTKFGILNIKKSKIFLYSFKHIRHFVI